MADYTYDNTYPPGRWNQPLLMEELAAARPDWPDLGIRIFFRDRETDTRIYQTVEYRDVPGGAAAKTQLDNLMSAHNPDADSSQNALAKSVRDKFLALGFTIEEIRWMWGQVNG